MLFSFKELKRLANLPHDILLKDVIKCINTIGFEVEETIAMPKISGVKFGKVIKAYKNPQATRLNVLDIEFIDKQRTIQTTAINVKEGDIVLAFVPGAKVDDIKFNIKKMQGIKSEGMLSSWNELGISEENIRDFSNQEVSIYNDYIEDLSIDPISYLGLNDTLIDIDILSNRSDAQSHIIMAKEIAAYFNVSPLELKTQKSSFTSKVKVVSGLAKELVAIEALNDLQLSLYERFLLNKLGIKSINDIVDLTNLTLIMTGQPTHAYDVKYIDSLECKKVSGKVKVFGSKEVELKNTLAIISNSQPVSLAGVIGIENKGASNQSEKALIELGVFNIKDIRDTVKQIKLSTASAQQSSKILSQGTTKLALEFLSTKLNNFSKPINWKEDKKVSVKYSFEAAIKLAGFDITKEVQWSKAVKSLEILGFKFKTNKVIIPPYRHDIDSVQDINEEIFRFYGFNNFAPQAPMMHPSKFKWINNIKTSISKMSYQEVVTYSLISENENDINPFNFKQPIKLETFVSKKREVIRYSQSRSILEIAEYNLKRKMLNFNIFSEGMIGNEKNSIILASTIKSFNELKQDVVNLLPAGIQFTRFNSSDVHSGVSAKIMLDNKMIGWIGKISPFKTDIDIFIAEFILESEKYIKEVKSYSSDPLKIRDVTFELKLHEEIIHKLIKIDAFSIQVIDLFIKDDIKKITVRFIGNQDQIDKIDKKYN